MAAHALCCSYTQTLRGKRKAKALRLGHLPTPVGLLVRQAMPGSGLVFLVTGRTQSLLMSAQKPFDPTR